MQQEKGIMNRIVEAGRSEEVWRLNQSGKRKKEDGDTLGMWSGCWGQRLRAIEHEMDAWKDLDVGRSEVVYRLIKSGNRKKRDMMPWGMWLG